MTKHRLCKTARGRTEESDWLIDLAHPLSLTNHNRVLISPANQNWVASNSCPDFEGKSYWSCGFFWRPFRHRLRCFSPHVSSSRPGLGTETGRIWWSSFYNGHNKIETRLRIRLHLFLRLRKFKGKETKGVDTKEMVKYQHILYGLRYSIQGTLGVSLPFVQNIYELIVIFNYIMVRKFGCIK